MAYCGPKGIPLSEFLSWDEADQDAALVWQEHEARRCPSCHTHPDSWDESRGGRRDAYLAEVIVCPGCRTIEAARKREEKNDTHVLGAHLMLRPRSILEEV